MNGFVQEILERLSRSMVDFPNRNAFCINGVFYSYSRFAEKVSSIRCQLAREKGMGQIVGLVVRDEIETYAAIIALWMEGKAYVPLHPMHPKERNLGIIEQVGLTHVIDTDEETVFTCCSVLNPKRIGFSETKLEWEDVSDGELAYILFTSGSTGVPKGVSITRGNLAAFVDSFWKTGISLCADDKCLQCFDLTFDVSVQSFLIALLSGACVYTVPYGQVKYLYVAKLIQEQGITFGAMAPSMLTYLRPYFSELDASSFKVCILTAEACPVDLLEDWSQSATNADLYDFYGPTEATIYCTYYKFITGGDNLSSNGIVSIGEPLANVDAIIIDEFGNTLFGSEKGELCVSGPQVTPGYWNNQKKNAMSFFVKTVDGEEKRYYHTGDLCYRDLSGNIMYLGRMDQQVKIQGFRVELSEIEFHSRRFFKGEKRVVAVTYNNRQGFAEVVLFVESEAVKSSDLFDYLHERLPSYMIPSRIIFENSFPMNGNDKIDRNRLKEKLM